MANTVTVINLREGPKTTETNEQPEQTIFEEEDTTEDASYWNALYEVVVFAACILNASALTLIPRTNSILYPEYWYETPFVVMAVVCVRYSAVHILELNIFSGVDSLLTLKHFAKVFIICSSLLV